MAPVLLTFIVIVAIVYGLYWMLVVQPEEKGQAALRRRLAAGGTEPARLPEDALERPISAMSGVGVLNMVLERSSGLSGPLERLVTQSGLPITVGMLLLSSALLGGLVFLAVNLLTYRALLALAVAAPAATLPYFAVRYARRRRLAMVEEQLPEAVDLMARALRAGHAFTSALLMAADELPAPVGPECRLLYDRQNFGMPLADALQGFAERVPLLDTRMFATAVLTQRATGGNLSEVLSNLAAVTRERFKVKRQVRVVSAHGRITGWILSAQPPVLAAVLWFVSPEYMGLLLSDPLGPQMIVAGLLLQATGVLIIRKVVNVPY